MCYLTLLVPNSLKKEEKARKFSEKCFFFIAPIHSLRASFSILLPSTSIWVQTEKTHLYIQIFPQFSCFFFLFQIFKPKKVKKHLLTSVWSVQPQMLFKIYNTQTSRSIKIIIQLFLLLKLFSSFILFQMVSLKCVGLFDFCALNVD